MAAIKGPSRDIMSQVPARGNQNLKIFLAVSLSISPSI